MWKYTTVMGAALCAASPARAGVDVSGHVGIVTPFATFATNGDVATIADAPTFGMPVGVGFGISERATFDMEFVPFVTAGAGTANILFHPGVVVDVGQGFGAGARAAFETAGAWGVSPIVNKGFPMGDTKFFVEGVLPIRFAQVDEKFTAMFSLALHLGVGF